MFYVYADLCSLLAATSQFSILIGQKMQLTGCHNDEMRNAWTPKFQLSGPTVHSYTVIWLFNSEVISLVLKMILSHSSRLFFLIEAVYSLCFALTAGI